MVLGHYNNNNMLLESENKTNSVLTSKKASQINSERSTNKNAITNNVIDTTLLTLKAKVVNGNGISCTISVIHMLNGKKAAKRVW